jgi:hypothetical protein
MQKKVISPRGSSKVVLRRAGSERERVCSRLRISFRTGTRSLKCLRDDLGSRSINNAMESTKPTAFAGLLNVWEPTLKRSQDFDML